jgi:hypothetical protein
LKESGDRINSNAKLKKPAKFHTLVQVSVESDVPGHQQSVKLARPLDKKSLLCTSAPISDDRRTPSWTLSTELWDVFYKVRLHHKQEW